ncbi:MAG TPA: DUF1743 domain-containing protein [Thermoplasmata archaeon]
MIRAAESAGADLIGEPRLVRLDPNVPWKTRGNGALSARFGQGRGTRRRIGVIGGEPVWSFSAGGPLPSSRAGRVVEAAWAAVRAGSIPGPASEPALVAAPRRLPASLYWKAVRTVVPIEEVEGLLRESGATYRGEGRPRGLVGAAAAVAWAGHHPTWELLAYRQSHRVGTPRSVDARSVRAAQARYPSLFLCYDGRTRRLLVAPHTACPILFGLRSTDPKVLPTAAASVRSEPVDRWLIFRTNQGTGDHVGRTPIDRLAPFSAGRIEGSVASAPVTGRGGHVRLDLVEAGGGRISCLVFEPTKTLPRVARALLAGDRVGLWGGRADDPTFRVEGIVVRSLIPRYRPAEAPSCRRCGHRTRSLGRLRGFRCPSCRTRFPPELGRSTRAPPSVSLGVHHPTPSARRHLAPRGPEVRGDGADL